MSYGPGRGDPAYEFAGRDYPLPYVRWTEQRNMEAFLGLIEEGRVTPKAYVTHRFAIAEAEKAYELMEKGEPHLAMLLTYPDAAPRPSASSRRAAAPPRGQARRRLHRHGQLCAQRAAAEGEGRRGRRADRASSPRPASAPTIPRTNSASPTPRPTSPPRSTIPPPHAVFIATRHDSHAALAARALAAGKHVFCEKPLALDRASLEAAHRRRAARAGRADRRLQPPLRAAAQTGQGGAGAALRSADDDLSRQRRRDPRR